MKIIEKNNKGKNTSKNNNNRYNNFTLKKGNNNFTLKLIRLKNRRFISYNCFNIFMILISINLCGNLILKSGSSVINITINNTGKQRIFSDTACVGKSLVQPDKIYINGKEEENVASYYDLIEPNNNITLFWSNETNSLACLFQNCNNISRIDLSEG